jgi:hypothetical protein
VHTIYVYCVVGFKSSLELMFYCYDIYQLSKNILNYAYVLKNGVGRYNIFFEFLHKACWILLFVSFSHGIRQCFYSSTIRLVPCAHILLETKIMNFMSGFFSKKYNQDKSSVVNNMQYNFFNNFPLFHRSLFVGLSRLKNYVIMS